MATIFIWNNHMFHMSHKWAGHASMSIDDTWPANFDDIIENYVSWVPCHDARSLSRHKRGIPAANILEDIYYEGYGPDHVIKMKFEETDTSAMKHHWRFARTKNVMQYTSDVELQSVLAKYKDASDERIAVLRRIGRPDSGPSFRRFRKNCSTMVANVLTATIKSSEAQWFRRYQLIWTPLHVKRFAIALGGLVMSWADFVQQEAANSLSKKKVAQLLRVRKREFRMGSTQAPSVHYNGLTLMCGSYNDMDAFKLCMERQDEQEP